MTDPDRALADAVLFAEDALVATKAAMAGSPDTGTATMAVFLLPAVAGLWPELERKTTS